MPEILIVLDELLETQRKDTLYIISNIWVAAYFVVKRMNIVLAGMATLSVVIMFYYNWIEAF